MVRTAQKKTDKTLPKPKAKQRLRGLIVINKGAGTVRSMGEDNVRQMIEQVISAANLDLGVRMVTGGEIDTVVKKAIDDRLPAIIVGGGDGTVSSIASKLVGSSTALGILPLGTMNLYAKAARVPPGLQDALKALANADTKDVDVGEVNGRLFLHQVSFGVQPKLVRLRERIGYNSKLTKMLSGLRALWAILKKPASLRFEAEIDGRMRRIKSPAVIVSNNLYGESALPFQDKLDDGVLGLYIFKSVRLRAAFAMVRSFLRGSWKESPHVIEGQAQRIVIKRLKKRWRNRRRVIVSIDGELKTLPLPIEIIVKPKSLKLLVSS